MAVAFDELERVRTRVKETSDALGRPIKILVGKPGLDGHSNGAEQIAIRARDAGFEVVYEGIRLTPAQIVVSALEESVHTVGLSILSGSHMTLIPAVMQGLRTPASARSVVVGGIIPGRRAPPWREPSRAGRAPRPARRRATRIDAGAPSDGELAEALGTQVAREVHPPPHRLLDL